MDPALIKTLPPSEVLTEMAKQVAQIVDVDCTGSPDH